MHHPQHCGPGRHQRNHCRLCTPLSPLILGIRSFQTPALRYLLATCLAQLWPYLESAREGFYTCAFAPKQKSTLCPYWLSSVCATALPVLASSPHSPSLTPALLKPSPPLLLLLFPPQTLTAPTTAESSVT